MAKSLHVLFLILASFCGVAGTISIDTSLSTCGKISGEPNHCGYSGGCSYLQYLGIPNTGKMRLTSCCITPSGKYVILAAYRLAPSDQYIHQLQPVKCQVRFVGHDFTFSTDGVSDYYFFTDSTDGNSYQIDVTWDWESDPVVDKQPSEFNGGSTYFEVLAGGTVTLDVDASNPSGDAGGISYQWQRRASPPASWQNYATATSTGQLTIVNAAQSHEGQFRCVISNWAGSTYSETIDLEVD